MDSIKHEFEVDVKEYTCRGCLSVNRQVKVLDRNVDIYLMLLDNKINFDDSKFQILLCWECTAVLKRIKSFQNQIQRAQYELGNIVKTSLSSLTFISKADFDAIYDGTVLDDIKVEQILSKVEVSVADIKEESQDASDGDIYEQEPETNLDDSDTYRVDIDINSIDRKPKKHYKYSNKLNVTRTPFDMNNVNQYISQVSHSLKEIESFKKEKKDLFKHIMPRKFLSRLKRLLALKKKDCLLDTIDCKKNTSRHICNHCMSVLPTNQALVEHWEQHTVETYQCNLCNRHYMRHSDLPLHFKQTHSYIYTCKECGISLCSLREYYMHNRQLHKVLSCDYCGKCYKNKLSIEKHIRRSHLPAKCKICNRTFEKYDKYRKHKRNHHQQPATGPDRELCYCVECDLQFDHMDAYKRHLRTAVVHKPKVPKRVPCPVCGKIFTRTSYMRNHYQLIHNKKSKHYCQICDKYYINGFGLRKHIEFVHNKHEKPKNKICDLCGRGFNANRTLINHRRTHTGERPYQCAHCPAAFAQLTAKKSHERTQHKNVAG